MRLLLAPMEGVIDHRMRALLTGLGGIDRCVTEFLRVSHQLLPRRVFLRLCPELAQCGKTPAGVPVFLQILGGDASVVADNAARGAELGAPGIDLNFGCPAKTVNRSDGGSVILREPGRVGRIVTATRAALPATCPLTVKIRLGFEDRSPFLEVVRAAAEAGAAELVIHARTRADGYRPPAHWEEIARARALVKIPIVANGEIWSPGDARRCREISGCEDLMLGRGVLVRPDLPRLIRAGHDAASCPTLSWISLVNLLEGYLEELITGCAPRHAGNPLKQWLAYLRHYYPQAALLFERVKRERDPQRLKAALRAEGAAAQAAGRDRPLAAIA